MYTSVVYIIRHGKSDFYKIGCTSHPEKRLISLQSGNPIVLTVDFMIHNDFYSDHTERHLHLLLDDRFIRGEWFDLPELSGDNYEKALLGWLNRLGVESIAIAQKDSCRIVEITNNGTRVRRAPEEIDTAVLLFLDTRCAGSRFGFTIGEIARALTKFYVFEICNSLHRMRKDNLVHRKRIQAHRTEYNLKSNPTIDTKNRQGAIQ